MLGEFQVDIFTPANKDLVIFISIVQIFRFVPSHFMPKIRHQNIAVILRLLYDSKNSFISVVPGGQDFFLQFSSLVYY